MRANTVLLARAGIQSVQARSISDDDVCSGCAHCAFEPGSLSTCSVGWPGSVDADGYVQECSALQSAE